LQSWFRENGGFRYSLDRAPGDSMETIVDFLTTDKVGYCEQFAASMALMARTLGIPARVGVGFLRPQPMGEDLYLYRGTDMHAWPELYFDGVGWLRFEPTPSRRTGDQAPSYSSEAGPEATAPVDGTVRAVDSDAIGESLGRDLLPGYIALTEQVPAADPALAPQPRPDLGRGPHFFYGLQWWFFALLALVGYVWFAWSEAHPRRRPERRHPEPVPAPTARR